EHFAREPIVPLSLFKNRAFTVSVIVGMLSGFGMFGAIIFTPLVFQGVLGVSATNSGTLITPMMIGLIGASILSGQLMVRIKNYKWLGTIGSAVMAIGVYILTLVTTHSTQLQVTSALIIVGAGLGITFPLYLNAVQSAVDRKFLGVVSSNMQFFRNVGGTLATAIFVLITTVATVFMPSVPLLAARRQPGTELGEASPVPEPAPEPEPAAVSSE